MRVVTRILGPSLAPSVTRCPSHGKGAVRGAVSPHLTTFADVANGLDAMRGRMG